MNDNTVLLVVIALAVVAIMIVGAVIGRRRAHARSVALQQHFGPEYDRAVAQLGGRAHAERELAARARRVEHFRFKELSVAERARFEASWNRIQGQFVDDPAVAVAGANELIDQVMRARGYPTENFEQRVADLSVEYPMVVQHYRAARALSSSQQSGQMNTEELRQAVVHYRVLFAELLHELHDPVGDLHSAHA